MWPFIRLCSVEVSQALNLCTQDLPGVVPTEPGDLSWAAGGTAQEFRVALEEL